MASLAGPAQHDAGDRRQDQGDQEDILDVVTTHCVKMMSKPARTMTPMMIPAAAQAMATGKVFLAPSIRALTMGRNSILSSTTLPRTDHHHSEITGSEDHSLRDRAEPKMDGMSAGHRGEEDGQHGQHRQDVSDRRTNHATGKQSSVPVSAARGAL